jgi:uncharacterized protein YecT (DUF1311 family)
MIRLAVVAALCAGPAAAQDFRIDPHLIDRCLGINGDTPMACVGTQAQACYDDYGGGPDMVMAACQEAELAYWDGQLNRTYAELLELTRAEQDSDVGYAPNQLTDAARAMQRSWIVYRDATCDLDLARAAPFGSAAGPAITGCLLRETARQVFQLGDIAGQYRQ